MLRQTFVQTAKYRTNFKYAKFDILLNLYLTYSAFLSCKLKLAILNHLAVIWYEVIKGGNVAKILLKIESVFRYDSKNNNERKTIKATVCHSYFN